MSHKPKVLIVDDEPLNVKLLNAMLPPDKEKGMFGQSSCQL